MVISISALFLDPTEDIDKFNVQAKEEGLITLKKYEPVNITQTEFDQIVKKIGLCQTIINV